MATFYYNHLSNENIYSQWTKHLQTNAYIGDIDSIIKKNRQELENSIHNSSSSQIKAINKVCGKLDDGFAEISNHLKSINSNISDLRGEINEMAAMLDWKLSLLIEEQRLTNQLLGNISKLLRIPDSQKQRVYHIEQGLKYLKNAILEGINSSFFTDSLEEFKKAENIERKDYITLNRIGQIYLYSEVYLNVPMAEEYFLKSAREAFAEANAGGTPTSNNFSPVGLENNVYSNNQYKAASAEAYLYASRACYLQQKLTEAASYAEKAYNLIPEFVEAGFEQAKYLAANNQEIEAAKVLETVIEKDRFYSIKTLNDMDLSTRPAILGLLETFHENTIVKAKEKLNKCKSKMSSESRAAYVISDIENSIKKNSFISGMKALDLLSADYNIPLYAYSFINDDSEKYIQRKTLNPKLKLSDFIDKENQSKTEYSTIAKEAKEQIVSSDKMTGCALGGGIGIFILCGLVLGLGMDNLNTWGNTIVLSIIGVAIFAPIGRYIGYLSAKNKEPKVIDKK